MSTEGVVISIIMALIFVAAGYGVYDQYKTQAKREREANLAEQAAKQRAKENLTGKKTVVVLRKKDGGQTMLETLLIKSLMEYGASVVSLPREIADQIADGKFELIPDNLVCFVGSAWAADGRYHIDVRAMQQDGDYMTGAYVCFSSPEEVAEQTAREIGSTLKVLAKIEADRS